MKAVVLAAGRGSRLKPYTDHLPKVMLPVQGQQRIIDYVLAPILDVFRDVLVVGGYRAEAIKDYLELRYPQVRFVRVSHLTKGNLLSLITAYEFVGGDDFIVTNGDHVFGKEIKEFFTENEISKPTLACHRASCRQIKADEMKVRVQDGRLMEISKSLSVYDGAYVGIFKVGRDFSEEFWGYVKRLQRKGQIEDMVVEDVFKQMIKDKNSPYVRWLDNVRFYEVDTKEDLEVLCSAVQSGGV